MYVICVAVIYAPKYIYINLMGFLRIVAIALYTIHTHKDTFIYICTLIC